MHRGIRIQHPTKRSTTFVLVDGSRPYRQPWHCPPPPDGCASTHLWKTYHLRLDESGAVIVSPEIVERLRRIPFQPFQIANGVTDPPSQIVRVPLAQRLARAPAPAQMRVGGLRS